MLAPCVFMEYQIWDEGALRLGDLMANKPRQANSSLCTSASWGLRQLATVEPFVCSEKMFAPVLPVDMDGFRDQIPR